MPFKTRGRRILTPTHAECSRCQRVLPRAEFYRHGKRADGLTVQCKECHATQVRDYSRRMAAGVAERRLAFSPRHPGFGEAMELITAGERDVALIAPLVGASTQAVKKWIRFHEEGADMRPIPVSKTPRSVAVKRLRRAAKKSAALLAAPEAPAPAPSTPAMPAMAPKTPVPKRGASELPQDAVMLEAIYEYTFGGGTLSLDDMLEAVIETGRGLEFVYHPDAHHWVASSWRAGETGGTFTAWGDTPREAMMRMRLDMHRAYALA